MRFRGRIFGVVGGVEFLEVVFGNVGDDHLNRAQDSEAALGVAVQIVTNGVLEHGDISEAVVFSDTDMVGKTAEGAGGNTTPAQAADGGHPGIVPAADQILLHQLQELAFAHDRITEIETGKLILVRQSTRQLEGLEDPVVTGAVDFKLQSANE